jgi:hypothetical protein
MEPPIPPGTGARIARPLGMEIVVRYWGFRAVLISIATLQEFYKGAFGARFEGVRYSPSLLQALIVGRVKVSA